MTTTYVKQVSGSLVEGRTVSTSAGAGDADKIPSLDASGRLDGAFLASGTVPAAALVVPAICVQQSLIEPFAGNNTNTSTATSGRLELCYFGRVTYDITVLELRFSVTSAGSGAQTAEAALYSSPAEPAGAAQDLTRLAVVSSITSLTSSGAKIATFNTSVSAGTRLWAGIRIAMASTQPTTYRTRADMGLVAAQTYVTAPGALTGLSTITAASQTLPTVSQSSIAMLLRCT